MAYSPWPVQLPSLAWPMMAFPISSRTSARRNSSWSRCRHECDRCSLLLRLGLQSRRILLSPIYRPYQFSLDRGAILVQASSFPCRKSASRVTLSRTEVVSFSIRIRRFRAGMDISRKAVLEGEEGGGSGRVGMKRLTPLPRQVSSSLAPNRTCEFPRIRLSMRGLRHGCPSQRCEGEGRFPELVGSPAEAFSWVVPSVRYA